ncbi:MAG TPA: bifunctional 2-C-methyl-D-erythritol 4-phosphate cytidylyltransferase/2-C-methyl-D-erythritol 2,4-cyclodiphosphate synthase [Rhodospirillaceae bacterium]|nr:bifunctional 2-C-methyl-D-erythritol 4-phosphate cytidylyltransferase/2-C-methyl-D-erythritol 2,4-cyclodiphosphate synthase [Rhodospirillaceae bacterium]
MVKRIALVVAAGRGSRFGGNTPKQWCDLGGRPVLRHSLAIFAAHPEIDAVCAVIHDDDRALFEAVCADLTTAPGIRGGATRQDSVRLGLEAIAPLAPDQVLIHDGARPFIDSGLVSRVISGLDRYPGAIPALPVHDTLKRGSTAGLVEKTVPRDGLYRAQTPQGFHFAAILKAHQMMAGQELTDDAAVIEQAGMTVTMVPGSEDNRKITTPEDLQRALEHLAGAGGIRVASGFDVHKFTAGDHVVLCNLPVPHEAALEGHSDADVALHALTDALLGTIAAGDIGRHFPPTESRWKGADSAVFLSHSARLVRAMGGEIQFCDLTIICERPKIGPYRSKMVARVAEILEIPAHRVSIKATTTEGLGFTGRREGIAAQATVTVKLQRA